MVLPSFSSMRLLARRRHSDAERRLTELQLWVVSSGASCCLIDLQPYETCRVAGVVERLTLDPVAGHLDVSVTDGTDRVTARWAIRRPLPQLACVPGRLLVIEGMAIADGDCLVMLEPTFELNMPAKAA